MIIKYDEDCASGYSLNQNLDQSCDILPNISNGGLVRFFTMNHEDEFATYELTIMHVFNKKEMFIVSQKVVEKGNIKIEVGK